MADAVNLSLENTVREAEDLEKSGIFTVSEVKFIFQKRARFEYLLRRRRAPPGRYLSYIKFETEVYKLYRLRKHPTKHDTPLSNVVAHALIRKIHGLYQRALRKYRGNVGLWLQFTTFCYLHGNQRLLSEVIAQALQLNPACAGLWSFAAQWEYKRKGDVSAARYLLMRGLRNCKQSKVLWQAYFHLEMLVATDMLLRRQVLLASKPDDEEELGAVAELVFDSAVRSHPEDIAFYIQFIAISSAFDWARSLQENLTSKISASLKHSNPRLDVSLLAGTMGSLSNMNETTGSDLTLSAFAMKQHIYHEDPVSLKRTENFLHFLRKICVPDRLSKVKSERSEVGGGHVLLRRSALALLRLSHISSGFYKSSGCGRGVFDLHGASTCSRENKNHFMSARVMHDVLHARTTVGDFPLDVAVGRNSLSTFGRIKHRLHNTSSGRVLSALGFWSCGRTSAQVKDTHLKDDK